MFGEGNFLFVQLNGGARFFNPFGGDGPDFQQVFGAFQLALGSTSIAGRCTSTFVGNSRATIAFNKRMRAHELRSGSVN